MKSTTLEKFTENGHDAPLRAVHPGLRHADRLLGLLASVPAAFLLLAEIVLLFSSVVMRYLFHAPLVWGDELAGILFLWLSMTGAAAALHRSAHMRMTAVVSRSGARWSTFWDTVSLLASLLFLSLVMVPTWHHVNQQFDLQTPALEISDVWRVAGILYGMVCMFLMCIVRMLALGWKQATLGIALVAAIVTALTFSGPVLAPLGNTNLTIFFVGVVGFTVLSGMPIAFSFGLATFSYLSLCTSVPMEIVVGRMDEGMSQLLLLAVPMFVFLGLLIEMTGMARTMIGFLASLVGHRRGGLSYVLVGAMYLVSGISGSKAADMAAVAPVLFPEMTKRGEKKGELVALLSATGAQTETVPPSIVLLTIGSVTGVSISALFTGGLLPGLVLAFTLCSVVWWRARKTSPSAGRAPRAQVMKALVVALPAMALPLVIRVAVTEGIATATEVSTVGIVYSVVVGCLLYRQFDWKRVGPMLVESATLSGAILLIIGTATAMAWSLTQSGFSHTLAQFMAGLPGKSIGFMAMSIVLFIVLGSVLEGIPAIVLFGPLMFPIARELGIPDVQYAMVVILSMGLGLFSPPFGVGYYGACAVSKINPNEGIRPIAGYMLALLIGIVIVASIPWISTGFLETR
ncbi:TRAP transporter large permease [Chitinasiproducens palmae]|uniref:TRAP transporter, DctM subunit n=1 Tax=Chitinasiproducens palmae TaxID=1770053 RepID=A0A1H2PPG7_9BURK|nr:TRAP transporter large permease subunit [Chitinasiproducens palmae]SDV48654.1 TRAP transporter, DctM subunit [Chitinasiproducens palmae]